MILSSYFVPHSPVLNARIGKEHTKALPKTLAAFAKIREVLEHTNVDTLILFSSHGHVTEDAITLNLHTEYKLDFSEFGDLITRGAWKPDMETINRIAYDVGKHVPINLISDETIDYGMSIPLLLLTEHLPSVKIVPISYGALSLPEMLQFGKLLDNALAASSKNIVILATGDLSHRLTEESVSGYTQEAKRFDDTVQKAILDNTVENLTSIDRDLLTTVGQCGLRALLALAGAMHAKNSSSHIYAYETSLGIGYLTAGFELP